LDLYVHGDEDSAVKSSWKKWCPLCVNDFVIVCECNLHPYPAKMHQGQLVPPLRSCFHRLKDGGFIAAPPLLQTVVGYSFLWPIASQKGE
jgi:hypothetical protein